MKRLLLASGSPRRRQLLKEAGYIFHTLTLQISETLNENLILDERIKAIAYDKAAAARTLLQSGGTKDQDFDLDNGVILTADTVVVLDQDVLGKPKDREQAFSHLSRLSGANHEVKTAICLMDPRGDFTHLDIETSRVTFRPLNSVEINAYIATGDPMDKAGAYGIQGYAGRSFIEKLDGHRDNVMGLSITCLENLLRKNNLVVERVRV